MNHIERVLAAIAHQEIDRVPWGEFWLEKGLVKKLLPGAEKVGVKEEAQVLENLGMDIRAIPPGEQMEKEMEIREGEVFCDAWGRTYIWRRGKKIFQRPAITGLEQASSYVFPRPGQFDYSRIGEWSQSTDFFLFALLDGVFQGVASLLDFNEFLMATAYNPAPIKELAEKRAQFLIEQAELCVKAGAHGIMIGEDMAYNQGTFISPKVLRSLFFPVLKAAVAKIKKLGVPVFLHSDGNLNSILEDLVELGIDGLQSLEPEAGMDLAQIKSKYGARVCLMGNLDLGLLTKSTAEEVARVTEEVLTTAAPGSGFILSTSGGILGQDIPAENLAAVSQTLKSWNYTCRP